MNEEIKSVYQNTKQKHNSFQCYSQRNKTPIIVKKRNDIQKNRMRWKENLKIVIIMINELMNKSMQKGVNNVIDLEFS